MIYNLFPKVSERLLEGRKLEFYTWAGDAEDLLKNVREKLNMLGEVGFVDYLVNYIQLMLYHLLTLCCYVGTNAALVSGCEK